MEMQKMEKFDKILKCKNENPEDEQCMEVHKDK